MNDILLQRREFVKDWYLKNFEDDKLGLRIDPDITFNELVFALFLGKSFYGAIGVGDSVIRERIGVRIADLYWQGEYKSFYDIWNGVSNPLKYYIFKTIEPPFEKFPVMTEAQAKLNQL